MVYVRQAKLNIMVATQERVNGCGRYRFRGIKVDINESIEFALNRKDELALQLQHIGTVKRKLLYPYHLPGL